MKVDLALDFEKSNPSSIPWEVIFSSDQHNSQAHQKIKRKGK
jgi:hypothetical protein